MSDIQSAKGDVDYTQEEADSIFSQMTNLVDTGGDEVWLIQEDGSVSKEEGIAIWLNTAKFFVPDGGSRAFGIPNFSTEIYGEGEWAARRELDEEDLIGDDCADFNEGIDITRVTMVDGEIWERSGCSRLCGHTGSSDYGKKR